MLFEGAQSFRPELAVRLDPGVDFSKRFGSNAIQTPLAIRRYVHQPGITQDAQMLKNNRLAHADDFNEHIHRLGATKKGIEQ
jgi:hypothetical protein